MKKPLPVNTNNSIDKSIIILLMGVMGICIVILGFKMINHKSCDVVNFDVDAKEFRVGEIIRFKDYSENVSNRTWDFGDSSETRYDSSPFHTYETPGEYEITLTVNKSCEFSKKIVVETKTNLIDSTKIPQFDIPNTITVGQLLKIEDLTKGATSWEWRFGETANVNSTYKDPTYIYKTPGLKTITLIVNGDPKYSTQKRIDVIAETKTETKAPIKRSISRNRGSVSVLPYKPSNIPDAPNGSTSTPEDKPESKVPQISKTAFANKIIKVSKKEATAKDFKEFLCGNLQLPTLAKGKKTTFVEFCNKIKGKKIKIKSLDIFKNKKTNCIEYLSIDYSKGVF